MWGVGCGWGVRAAKERCGQRSAGALVPPRCRPPRYNTTARTTQYNTLAGGAWITDLDAMLRMLCKILIPRAPSTRDHPSMHTGVFNNARGWWWAQSAVAAAPPVRSTFLYSRPCHSDRSQHAGHYRWQAPPLQGCTPGAQDLVVVLAVEPRRHQPKPRINAGDSGSRQLSCQPTHRTIVPTQPARRDGSHSDTHGHG